jgi:L,D-transpeptidase catalytic domain
MKKKTLKHIYLFFSSVFIFLLHLPFVFAKTKSSSGNPGLSPLPKKEVKLTDTSLLGGKKPDSLLHTLPKSVYDSLRLNTLGLAQEVFDIAMRGMEKLKASGKIINDNIISVVDFSQESSRKRLYIIDLKHYRLLFNTWVAHGLNSGQEYATDFSNTPSSNKSSLGFYTTLDPYMGRNGYSLRLEGLERGFNDNARNRDIVIHGADYVNEEYIRSQGWIGRSWGCPAVHPAVSRAVINEIKNGTCLFIYSPNQRYLHQSRLIN